MITLKLKISEDTACVASKTSYIDEDGLDKNGIYYFGDKPNLPTNWRKVFKKSKNVKQITERVHGGIYIPPCPKEELKKLSISMNLVIGMILPSSIKI